VGTIQFRHKTVWTQGTSALFWLVRTIPTRWHCAELSFSLDQSVSPHVRSVSPYFCGKLPVPLFKRLWILRYVSRQKYKQTVWSHYIAPILGQFNNITN